MRARLFGLALGIYLLVLFDLTLVQFRHPGANRSNVNLRPFATIGSDLRHGGREFVVNFVGNLVAFMPLGVLMMAARRGRLPARSILFTAFVLSALIEGLQYRVGGRVSDVDDVILNILGSWCGVGLYRVGRRHPVRLRWRGAPALARGRAWRPRSPSSSPPYSNVTRTQGARYRQVLVVGWIGLAFGAAGSPAADAPQDQAAEAITQAGGKLDRDEKAPGQPITAVSFATLPIEDGTLACLEGLEALQKLTLNGTKITDAGLDRVQGLGSLRKLYLVDTRITDAGLAKLKALSNLQVLSLVGTDITDAGLEHLKALTNLQTVFLAGTKVTDAGVQALQDALPKLKIER